VNTKTKLIAPGRGAACLSLYPEPHAEQIDALVAKRVEVGGGANPDAADLGENQSDLAFGGCGNSGFGRYRGGEGFKAFSNQRPVFTPTRFDVNAILRPPYGDTLRRAMRFLLKP
jgi:hypothetical protein